MKMFGMRILEALEVARMKYRDSHSTDDTGKLQRF
jgi:hypothetical protein